MHAIQEQAKEQDKTCYQGYRPEKDQSIANSAHLRNSRLGLENGTKVIGRGTIVLSAIGYGLQIAEEDWVIRMPKKTRRLWKPHR
ncbi:hypothetical protein GCM10009604_22150 [Corynebacterium aurimucosum]